MDPVSTTIAPLAETVDAVIDKIHGKDPYPRIIAGAFANATKMISSKIENYCFCELVLRARSNKTQNLNDYIHLIAFYEESGRLEKALEIAEEHRLFAHSGRIALKMGNLDKASQFKGTPRTNCNIETLACWLKYHELNMDVQASTNDFVHDTNDGKALVEFYRGNYAKALSLFDGTGFGERILWYKLYLYLILGVIDQANFIIKELSEDEVPLSFTFFEETALFSLLEGMEKSLNSYGFFKDRFFDLYNINLIKLREKTTNTPREKSFLTALAGMHSAPYVKIHTLLNFGLSDKQELISVQYIQKNTPGYTGLDVAIIHSWFVRNKHSLIIQYCHTRAPFSFHFSILASFFESFTPEKVLTAEAHQKYLTQSFGFVEQGKDNHYATPLLAVSKLKEKKYDEAYRLFVLSLEHLFYYNFIIYAYQCLKLQEKHKEARSYLLTWAELVKNPPFLLACEDELKDSPDLLYMFYQTNFPYSTELARRYQASMTERLKKSVEEERQVDISTLLPAQAIEILTRRIKLSIAKPQDYIDRSFYYYLSGNIELAKQDVKSINFDDIDLVDLEKCLKNYTDKIPKFAPFIIPYVPKDRLTTKTIRLLINVYFQLDEYSKALTHINQYLKNFEDPDLLVMRVRCLYKLGSHAIALSALQTLMETNSSSDMEELKAEIVRSQSVVPLPEEVKPISIPKRAPLKPTALPDNPLNGFVSEKPRLKEERVKEMAMFAFGGSKSMKGVPDPIQHSSNFDPLAYKPKDESAVQTVSGKRERAPAAPVAALVETKISQHYKKTLEHARTLLLKMIHLNELYNKGEINTVLLRNNLLYTYLRVFEIISFKTVDPSLKDSLTNTRYNVRHLFNLVSTEQARALLNNLIKDKLSDQLADWMAGTGILNKLVLCTINLIDTQSETLWNGLSHLQKDINRIAFIKSELQNLVKFMESVKTEGVFEGDGPNENAAKMSIMMIGKCWSKLSPPEKKKLSPYFQEFNLEGNKAAHNFKNESEQLKIKFIHHFDDIALNDMWKFAQDAPKLITFLESYGSP